MTFFEDITKKVFSMEADENNRSIVDMSDDTLMSIPVTTLIEIALHLEPEAIFNFCRGCKYFNGVIANNEDFWILKFWMDFGEAQELVSGVSAKEQYRFVFESSKLQGWISSIMQRDVTIDELQTVEKLFLGSSEIDFIPASIGILSSLQELWLTHNKIASLPKNFGNLLSLRTLSLRSNRLKSLPESFGNLSTLKVLYLNNNELESLPESFGNPLGLGGSLELLRLDHNKLKSEGLPESFGNLAFLQGLYLVDNELKYLPESFGNLFSLKVLHLSFNYLESLPDLFGNLGSLEALHLSNNKLEYLPESFGNPLGLGNSLRVLYLKRNCLKSLPASFVNFSLQELHLDDDELRSIGNLFS